MTIPELPTDLLEEILCRLPARSMKRLRLTCKLWNRLFKDRRFVRKHCDKAAKQFLVLMLTKEYSICPISVNLQVFQCSIPSVELKGKLRLLEPQSCNSSAQIQVSGVFHCDGLLLCTLDNERRRIVVWNPFTGETRWINAEKNYENCSSFVLGYYYRDNKSSCKSYKILSYYDGSGNSEIYELNSDSWRVLDDDIAPGWSIVYKPSVSLKGKTYWFAEDETETNLGTSLLRFDFATEKSGPVPLPYQCHSYEVVNLSVVREEKLSVLLQREVESKTEIWVSNKIDDDETKAAVSWSKVLALDLSPDLDICDYGSFLLDEEKKVMVRCDRWTDMEDENKSMDKIYIVGEDNKVTQVDFGVDDFEKTDLCWPLILNYAPSLVQIERAGGKRKRGD